jgi:hypothetical protein
VNPTPTICPVCEAVLGPWERSRCSCSAAPRWVSAKEVLYAVACTTAQPLRIRDFTRLAEAQHGLLIRPASASVALSSDYRFCWAGQGLYGLYRHGPLPGSRNLEQAARIILVAAGVPLTAVALDFVLKRRGYRFHPVSLTNALSRSRHISWRPDDGQWQHPTGEQAELSLRKAIPVVLPRQREQWQLIRDRIHAEIHIALADRQKVLRDLSDLTRYGIDWDSDVG